MKIGRPFLDRSESGGANKRAFVRGERINEGAQVGVRRLRILGGQFLQSALHAPEIGGLHVHDQGLFLLRRQRDHRIRFGLRVGHGLGFGGFAFRLLTDQSSVLLHLLPGGIVVSLVLDRDRNAERDVLHIHHQFLLEVELFGNAQPRLKVHLPLPLISKLSSAPGDFI